MDHLSGRLFLAIIKPIYMLWVPVLIIACNGKPTEADKKGRELARTFDQVLYEEDVREWLPDGTLPEDSITFVNSYVRNWIKQNLLLRRAELNLDENQVAKMEVLIRNYRNDLLQYMYKRAFVSQKLDTLIGEEEIQSYYDINKDKFELQDDIAQFTYARFEKTSPSLDQARKWYASGKAEDKEAFKDHCFKYASSYFLNDSIWLDREALLKAIPVDVNMLRSKRSFETEDSLFIYFVNIVDFRAKESPSPYGYERGRIREILINKRKLQLLEKLEKDLYDEALRNNQFEIYTP
ncbi:MAG: hypothetical protein KDD36_07720 [Flavobacteriales bacterium]|nr:hypothetical protein [Flavobacteriales bacterium]